MRSLSIRRFDLSRPIKPSCLETGTYLRIVALRSVAAAGMSGRLVTATETWERVVERVGFDPPFSLQSPFLLMPRRGFESKVLRIFGYNAFYLLGVRLVALAVAVRDRPYAATFT
jgi:hypothetical protein